MPGASLSLGLVLPLKRGAGSIPAELIGLVSQLVDDLTFNQEDAGSSPVQPT